MKIGPAILFLGVTAISVGAQNEGVRLDGYAAVVNDRVITIGDVLSYIQPDQDRLREKYRGTELRRRLEQLFEDGRKELIERALILEDAEEKKETIPDRLVDQQMEAMIHERFNNDRSAFLEALRETRMTVDDWRQKLKDRLTLMLAHRREVAMRVVISPSEIRREYEKNLAKYRVPAQVHLSMIVIKKKDAADTNTTPCAAAAALRERLANGEEFSLLARKESSGPHAEEGGDWGWIAPSDLRPELARAVRQLKAGMLSPVIETDDACYIIKVIARRPASVKSLEEVRPEIEKKLRRNAEKRLYEAWIQRLRKKYFVKVFPVTP